MYSATVRSDGQLHDRRVMPEPTEKPTASPPAVSPPTASPPAVSPKLNISAEQILLGALIWVLLKERSDDYILIAALAFILLS